MLKIGMEDKVHAGIGTSGRADDPKRRQIDEWAAEARELARSEPEQALALAWDARKFARELAYERGEAEALLAGAVAQSVMGAFDEAATVLERVREIAERLGDARLTADRENILCFFHYNRGEQKLALEAAFRSVARWREIGDPRELVKPLVNLSSQLINTGRTQDAIARLNEALALTQADADTSARAIVLSNIGIIHLRNREPARALPYLEEAVGLMEARREYQNAILNLFHLTDAYLELGRAENGEAAAERALRLAKEFGQPQSEVLALRTQATARAKGGEPERALPVLRRALRLARRRGVTYDAAGLLTQTAACLRTLGKNRAARLALREAVRHAHDAGDRYSLADARLQLSEVCAALHDWAGAYENFRAYHETHCPLEREEARAHLAAETALWHEERARLETRLAERNAEIARLRASEPPPLSGAV
jgi:tetratricopeptide (TPR) repeat protein